MMPESTFPPPAPPPTRAGYSGLRLFRRLFAVALPGLLALLLVSAVALLAFIRLGSQASKVEQAVAASATVNDLKRDLTNLKASLDAMTTVGTQYNDTVYQVNITTILGDRATLYRLDLNSFSNTDRRDQQEILGRLKSVLDDLRNMNETAIRDARAGATQWRVATRPDVEKTEQQAGILAADLETAAQTTISTTTLLTAGGQIGIGVATIIAILASLSVAALFTRNIMRPIRRLQHQMAQTAAGDLTGPPGPILAVQSDELALLEHDYQHTLAMLRPLIGRIQADAAHISASAAQISAAAAQQATGSQEQAAAITQVTVTVEQLNQTAAQIAEAATSVAAAADQALLSANRGQDAVRDSVLGMAMIKTRVNDITARILALSAQSQRIGEVIDLINTIAAQTHILALNAAVESAGAADSEQGQRFAVVAAEVKKLAGRSVAATKEVRVIIGQIQAATAAAVLATEEGLKETDRGVELAHQSGDANEDIISMVERTTQLASAISLATQQQRTASEQVVATMREVAEVTRQAAVSSQQASEAANELSTIAAELRSVSQGFTLAATGADPEPADQRALPNIAAASSLPSGSSAA